MTCSMFLPRTIALKASSLEIVDLSNAERILSLSSPSGNRESNFSNRDIRTMRIDVDIGKMMMLMIIKLISSKVLPVESVNVWIV